MDSYSVSTDNILDYRLYLEMAEIYMGINPYQAYLCLENALFLCGDSHREDIGDTLKALINAGIFVRAASFIILSYNSLEYTRMCIESVRKTVPTSAREIIVIDNASTDGSVEYLKDQSDIITIFNDENVGFPKGCNQGIKAASNGNDIFLLNNDTVILPNSLFWLRMSLYGDEKVGSVGSVTNYAGNRQIVKEANTISLLNPNGFNEMYRLGLQINSDIQARCEEKLYLIGFALLIRRKVIEEVGLLDEIFTPGNFEDVDYGIRIIKAGYKNILCHNSFIVHFGSVSFGKNTDLYLQLLNNNVKKFKLKYGFDVQNYKDSKNELLCMFDKNTDADLKILNMECGLGTMALATKFMYPNAEVFGSESNSLLADISKKLIEVENVDADKICEIWEKDYFDYVVIGKDFSSLSNPQSVLRQTYDILKKDGIVLMFFDNMMNYSKVLPLLKSGNLAEIDNMVNIGCSSSVFTKTDMELLLADSGYTVETCCYSRDNYQDTLDEEIIKKLTEMLGSANAENYLASEYFYKVVK